MEELLRKKYKLSVEFFGRFKRSKRIDFVFKQATLRELLEMKEELNDPDKVKKWLFDFLMKKTEKNDKLTPKLFDQLNNAQFNSIIEFLIKTYAKGFFSKVNDVESGKKGTAAPSSSMICTILEKTNETIESLMEMTWEQIEYLIEGIIWNVNASDKKGRERNAMKMRMKEINEADGDFVKNKLQRIEEKMRLAKLKK